MGLFDSLLSGVGTWSTWSTLSILFVFTATAHYIHRSLQRSQIPCVNSYPHDWFRSRAKQAFVERGAQLLEQGSKEFGEQPFRVITTLGEKLVLPKEWIVWVEKHPDLDHQAQVAEEFFGAYPGFEAIGAFNDPNKFVIDLVKKKMSSMTAPMLETFRESATYVLREEFGDEDQFHAIHWSKVCTQLISRMSANIFVGSDLAIDEDWQNITLTYTVNLFNACRVLRAWPAPLRPIAVWFLKECKVCRDQIAQAKRLVAAHAKSDASDGAGNAFAWMDPRADPAIIQLALAAGAIHTTSQLMNQALLDLAYAVSNDSTIASRLRTEWQSCTAASNGAILPSTLPKLGMLEACIKETQRLKPQVLTNLERLALRPVTLPNGIRIPKGTMVSVDSSTMWSRQTWGADAEVWNPRRWLSETSPGDQDSAHFMVSREKLVNSSDRHFAFGKGRFICPGRFMVNAELKVALGLILEGWDVRLSKGDLEQAKTKGRVEWVPYGFEMLADERIVVEVRRR